MTDYIANINTYKIGGDNFDGQWVLSSIILAQNVTYSATSKVPYDLSSYLPNDNFVYLVAFSGWGRTLSGSGSCTIRVMSGSPLYDDIKKYGCRMMTTEYHSTSSYTCSGNLILPIYPTLRYVSLANTASTATGNCGFYATGYRRLGTNE